MKHAKLIAVLVIAAVAVYFQIWLTHNSELADSRMGYIVSTIFVSVPTYLLAYFYIYRPKL